MLALQWNIDDAKTAWQQEAREEGRLEGRAMDFSDIPKEDRAKYSAALTNNIGSN